MISCDNCGADIPEGARECDFCGLTVSEMSSGSGAAVPLEHRLGDGVEIDKTFEDSQREHQVAMAHSQVVEEQRRGSSAVMKGIFTLMVVAVGAVTLYQLVVKAGWKETALNGVVLATGSHQYSMAHTRAARARSLAPTEAEPYFLEGAVYFLEFLYPGRDSNSPEQNLKMAESRLQRALAADSQHGPSHFYMGALRLTQDRPRDAQDHFERAVRYLENDQQALTRAFMDSSKEALSQLEKKKPKRIHFYSGAKQATEETPTLWEGKICAPFGRYPSQ